MTPDQFSKEIESAYKNMSIAVDGYSEELAALAEPIDLYLNALCDNTEGAFMVNGYFGRNIDGLIWYIGYPYRIVGIGDGKDVLESIRIVTEAMLDDYILAHR